MHDLICCHDACGGCPPAEQAVQNVFVLQNVVDARTPLWLPGIHPEDCTTDLQGQKALWLHFSPTHNDMWFSTTQMPNTLLRKCNCFDVCLQLWFEFKRLCCIHSMLEIQAPGQRPCGTQSPAAAASESPAAAHQTCSTRVKPGARVPCWPQSPHRHK